MLTHGDEEVEEEPAALLHLGLHGRALLEVVPVADDDSEVMAAEVPFRAGCVIIDPSC